MDLFFFPSFATLSVCVCGMHIDWFRVGIEWKEIDVNGLCVCVRAVSEGVRSEMGGKQYHLNHFSLSLSLYTFRTFNEVPQLVLLLFFKYGDLQMHFVRTCRFLLSFDANEIDIHAEKQWQAKL